MGDNSVMTANAPSPLTGVRVLELTTTVAGPFCGRLLADFGAEVIKVERPQGDDLRSFGMSVDGKSLLASSLLRNKSLIAVDLHTETGQQLARKLAARCDMVIENFRPGTLERWNLGYEQLAEDNPALVMVRVSGFGQTGPYANRPGYGIIAEALSGLRHLTGHPEAPPPRLAIPLTDYIAGVYAAFGATMALHHARQTGQGQVVDTALYEGAFSFTEMHVPAYGAVGHVANRSGHKLPSSTPNNIYPSSDGQHILIAAHAQSIFKRLCATMGQPDLAGDERFKDAASRAANDNELDEIVAEWSGRQTLEELEQTLHGAEIPASRIYNTADIFQDPHYQAREMLTELPDGNFGKITVTSPVPKLSATPGKLNWAGRNVGADTRRILEEMLGLAPEEVRRLETEAIVYCQPEGSS
jgi:crotonobetainyl-CoA:carnitine CoA-transferase CaiB-like acyl-CoA transferase